MPDYGDQMQVDRRPRDPWPVTRPKLALKLTRTDTGAHWVLLAVLLGILENGHYYILIGYVLGL